MKGSGKALRAADRRDQGAASLLGLGGIWDLGAGGLQEINPGSQEPLQLKFQRSFQAEPFVPGTVANTGASESKSPGFKSATHMLRDLR